ncbi:hypothetical protein [Streptomyces sp. NPDC048272]|uniref:hypothetical protein n=1 Tax=Streptomyces sp. NPDC048272 TaxID=3154616 RepID=UPI003447877C
MSTFPDGNFTIVNNETSRCVRVRLGRTKDVSDWQAGTKYLQSVTAKPTLELGEPDGSPATAWWFSTIDDAGERRPFNQIVSHAVGEYQNIGDHCVWLDMKLHPTAENRKRAAEHNVEEDPEGPEAAQAYMDAAAEEGIHPPQVESGRTSTRMHGCGANRDNTPPRWIRQASAGAWRIHSHPAVRPVPCSTRHRIPLQHADQRLRHAWRAAVPDVYGDGIGFHVTEHVVGPSGRASVHRRVGGPRWPSGATPGQSRVRRRSWWVTAR